MKEIVPFLVFSFLMVDKAFAPGDEHFLYLENGADVHIGIAFNPRTWIPCPHPSALPSFSDCASASASAAKPLGKPLYAIPLTFKETAQTGILHASWALLTCKDVGQNMDMGEATKQCLDTNGMQYPIERGKSYTLKFELVANQVKSKLTPYYGNKQDPIITWRLVNETDAVELLIGEEEMRGTKTASATAAASAAASASASYAGPLSPHMVDLKLAPLTPKAPPSAPATAPSKPGQGTGKK